MNFEEQQKKSTSLPLAYSTKTDKAVLSKDAFMPPGFNPGQHDVVIGRSLKYQHHSGNEALRRIVEGRVEEYSKAEKLEKSLIITEVVEEISNKSKNGWGFLKLDVSSKQWYKVCCGSARYWLL